MAKLYKGYFKLGEALLDLIYTDLSGTIKPRGFNNISCYTTFRDNKIIISEVYLLINKLNIVIKFKEFKARYKWPLERKIRRIRVNGGGKYAGKVFQDYFKLYRIAFEPTARKSPK